MTILASCTNDLRSPAITMKEGDGGWVNSFRRSKGQRRSSWSSWRAWAPYNTDLRWGEGRPGRVHPSQQLDAAPIGNSATGLGMGVAKVSEYKPGDRILNLCTLSFSSFCQSKGQKGVLPLMLVNVGTMQYIFAMRRGAAREGPTLPTIRCSAYQVQHNRVGNGSGKSVRIQAWWQNTEPVYTLFLFVLSIKRSERCSPSHVGERGPHTIPICNEEKGDREDSSLPTIRCSAYRVTAR